MVEANKGEPECVVGTDGKGLISIFLFIKDPAEIYHVHGNICKSNHQLVVEKLNGLINKFNADIGEDAGFLIILGNAKQHKKAISSVTDDWGYYPPVSPEQAALLNNNVIINPLYTESGAVSNSREQFTV